MANERQGRIVDETRRVAGALIDAWRAAQEVRNSFDALGGSPAFAALFAAGAHELTPDEVLAVMNFVNELDAFMTPARQVSLRKAR